jgi:predicted lipoprotein with Yx(FWY)xxD motif
MRVRLLLVAASLAFVAGCGSSGSSAKDPKDDPMASAASAAKAESGAASAAGGPRIKIVDSNYGRILSNGRGRALYLFTADRGKGSNCSGECATAWPPYIVKRKPATGPGSKAGLIGTTRRSDGKLQATYAGRPVYFYVGDKQPGEVLCQAVNEFGGYWYVVRANGKAVR